MAAAKGGVRNSGGKRSKAKSPAPSTCAVLWGLDPSSEKGSRLRDLLGRMGVVVRTVTPERLGDPAGSFARLSGFRPQPLPYAGPVPEGEFMLLCGFNNAQVDELIARCREEGCVVGPKALLTPANRSWPMVRLIETVTREHEANAPSA